ncbi:MAG TPA: hypothetical protein VGG90_03710 [Candidatus Dormibacteraeota bacterium]
MKESRVLRLSVAAALAAGSIVSFSGLAAFAQNHHGHGAADQVQARNSVLRSSTGTPDGDLADQQAQYSSERTAPAAAVSGAALASAVQQAKAMPVTGAAWQEVTTQPYNIEPSNYTDPFWSNIGSGFSLAGGRTTALVQTGDGAWFAGTADGGVWKSSNQGQQWTPLFDFMPSLSIGSLAVSPTDGSLWVGTGEANTSQDSYQGTGVYRSVDGGASFQPVGTDASGNGPLMSHTTFRLAFDPSGNAFAATDSGLFRLAAGTNTWNAVLAPAGATDNPPYDQQVTDVAVVPGTSGRTIITVIGWRGPGHTQNNGFYQSTDGGLTFTKVIPTGGAIDATDIGRTTFAYSADGSKLYAIVESPRKLTAGASNVLQGIFSTTGSPAGVAGPWTKIANSSKLAGSGSAASTFGAPGVQAWYNQDLAVDRANANHIYAGLEEVYESTDGGTSWITASPYWNYSYPCDGTAAGCPKTTHPDQHAMMITDGLIVIGNDGGVYSRPLSDVQQDGNWSDLNASLRSWQYYDARAGKLGGHGVGVWGGLQDNGTSVLATGSSQMVAPAGGDGFYVIVDPQNANKMAGEYVDGTMYSSTDGGHSFADFVSPTCASQAITGMPGGPRAGCDPAARFVTPLIQDQQNKNVWLIGGQFVWVSTSGWQTSCTSSSCSWQNVYDTGSGNSVTALSSANGGQIIYTAWVAGGGNPGPAFGRGIATNYGGTWHQLDMSNLPNRFIAGMTVDQANPAHAYAIFNGYSRRFIPGGGVGHVFETTNGGQSWTDISGNLPDIASDALILDHGRLALATDAGVYTATAGQGAATSWSVLGTGLPNASINDLTPGPDGFIYAATHGRGIWKIAF